MNSVLVVLQVDDGKWNWWEGLQVIDFLPSGKRHETISKSLSSRNNHFNGAVIAACKAEIERRKAMISDK